MSAQFTANFVQLAPHYAASTEHPHLSVVQIFKELPNNFFFRISSSAEAELCSNHSTSSTPSSSFPTPSGAAQNAFAFKRGANYRHHKKPVNTQALLYFQTRKTTLAYLNNNDFGAP
jgi:hypothetical protein